MKAILALEDGIVFDGLSIGDEGEAFGEVVFNTAMTGYQEILTDPSYKGQIVTMTYPHIGNYGVNSEDMESFKPHVEGFVVRELSPVASNYRAEMSLGEYLKRNHLVAIEGIDTRMLTKHLRDFGAKKGVISTVDLDKKRLIKRAKAFPSIVGVDLVKEVTCREPYDFDGTLPPGFEWPEKAVPPAKKYFAVCVDSGIKYNILRKLNQHGFRVKVVPAATTADQILALKPDGVFYSNGPGDPEPVTYLWENMARLVGKVPVFGICLGHQMLSLALGGKTFKLKFGHRGANHPVMDLRTGKVEITAQNHGFCVDPKSLPPEAEVTHLNLNDQTVEGLRHKKHPLFSVQYHPETSPGPHDSDYLFGRFYRMIHEGVW
jgi:carbamoyl-phosphate synthase small subunit